MKTQGSTKDVVFLSGVRTGFGTFGGTLKDLSATELGAVAFRHAVERSRFPTQEFDEIARASQQRAKQAWEACVFKDEVVPVPVPSKGKKGETTDFRADEH